MQEQWRVFIAIPLPLERKEWLKKQMDNHDSAVKAFKKKSDYRDYHITIQFLGDVEPDKVIHIHEAMNQAAASMQAFSLQLKDWGTFGQPASPRVLWCGIEGDLNSLQQLYGSLTDKTKRIGFEPEHRPYRPHLTISRQYQGTETFSMDKLPQWDDHSAADRTWKVDRIVLYRTRLGQRPMYEEIAESLIHS